MKATDQHPELEGIMPARTGRIISVLCVALLMLLSLHILLANSARTAYANPDEFYVKPYSAGNCSQSDPCGLPTALSLASDHDSIIFAPGIYTGTGGAVITITRSINLVGGWDGIPTGTVIIDPALYLTTLDGENLRRVIYITDNQNPSIAGLTIRHGNASLAVSDAGEGGGIFSKNADPMIENNLIISNSAGITNTSGSGGGIYLIGASASATISGNRILSNTNYSDNWGQGGGGVFLSYSDVQLVGNLLQGNTSNRAGAGIYIGCCGRPNILTNDILSNHSQLNGGGIYARYLAWPIISGNRIEDNQAGNFGGGIMAVNGQSPTINANFIRGNQASSGAGIVLETGEFFTVANNIITENGIGGGIKIWDLTRFGLVAHNTILYHTGTEGGIFLAEGYITPTLVNNIVVSNTYGIRAHVNSSGTLDYNNVWGNTTLDYDLPGSLQPGSHSLQQDPQLANPAAQDFQLQAWSPCINSGLSAGIIEDFDRNPRPVGPGYDMGAYESQKFWMHLPSVLKNYP